MKKWLLALGVLGAVVGLVLLVGLRHLRSSPAVPSQAAVVKAKFDWIESHPNMTEEQVQATVGEPPSRVKVHDVWGIHVVTEEWNWRENGQQIQLRVTFDDGKISSVGLTAPSPKRTLLRMLRDWLGL